MKASAARLTQSPLSAGTAGNERTGHVDNDGVRIVFETYGAGAPILLIPGFSQSREAWKQAGFVEPLAAAGRQVILIDPRGHGASDKPRAPRAYREEALAGDVIAVLDRLGIREADLLGYSRGSTIAIASAIRHPDRVRSIAIGGSHPYAEDMDFYRNAVADDLGRWIGIIEEKAGPLLEEARTMFLANDVEALRVAVAADRPDCSAALAASGVPVLLYAGTADPVYDEARRFAEAAGSRFLSLAGLNHMQAFFAAEPVVAAVVGQEAGEAAAGGAAGPWR